MSAGSRPALWRIGLRLYLRRWRSLLFFSACIASGVACLFGVDSVLSAVSRAVAARARELLAADVEASSSRPFEGRALAAFERAKARGVRVAGTLAFSSMLRPRQGQPFLVSVKAVEASYPFYGHLVTEPPGAPRACLLDRTAAIQHGLSVGDEVTLGTLRLRVSGLIVKEPDRSLSSFNLAPRLLIPLPLADRTGLMRFGSRIRHGRSLALPSGSDPGAAAELKSRLERELDDPYVGISSYTEAEPTVRETLQRVTTFFVLVSLVGLILGCVGMASSVTMLLNSDLETVGLLRCLGLEPRHVARLYQGLCLFVGIQGGALGAAAGWLLGALGLAATRRAIGMELDVGTGLDGQALARALGLACALAVGVNYGRIRSLAKVAPLDILRERLNRLPASPKTAAATAALALGALFLYVRARSASPQIARDFSLGLVGAVLAAGALIAACSSLVALAQPLLARSDLLALRHGTLQFVRRPGRTAVFLFTLSVGFSLLGALGIVHRSLSKEILLGKASSVPGLFLVDIQKAQLAAVARLASSFAAGEVEFAPLVRARLAKVNGVPVARRDLSGLDMEERSRQRFLTREYNLTYKDALHPSEKVAAGAFWKPGEERPQVSLEEGFAKRTRTRLGDVLTFDIQGRELDAPVTSLRSIEWMSMRPNFFVVLPSAALEKAPQTFIASLRVQGPERTARFQRALVEAFPGVSVFDVTGILDSVSSVLDTLLRGLRLLAWFCVGVGLLVLAGTLSLGRRERVQNAALLRALGCTRAQVLAMDAVEFLAIGGASFAIALLVSASLGWFLALRMDIAFSLGLRELATTLLSALLLPVLAGLAVNWRAYGEAVLESLRHEA